MSSIPATPSTSSPSPATNTFCFRSRSCPRAENIRIAKEFMQSRRGSGGTEMMKAIRAALDPSDEQDHIRVVCFITDGYVGNDMEIIGEIQKHPNARVFSFRHWQLGEPLPVEWNGQGQDGEMSNSSQWPTRPTKPRTGSTKSCARHCLTDISIDWGGLPVKDTYPQRIPDLFSGKPLVIIGRFTRTGERNDPSERQTQRRIFCPRYPSGAFGPREASYRPAHAVGAAEDR